MVAVTILPRGNDGCASWGLWPSLALLLLQGKHVEYYYNMQAHINLPELSGPGTHGLSLVVGPLNQAMRQYIYIIYVPPTYPPPPQLSWTPRGGWLASWIFLVVPREARVPALWFLV